MNLSAIIKVYEGSDGDATRALFERLTRFAPRGPIAVHLMRLSKASGRAKAYRGRSGNGQSWRAMAYQKKDWAIGELCSLLRDTGEAAGITSWGWARDEKAVGFENVIYVDIPGGGQVSFHTHYRRDGPDYAGAWDGVRAGGPRRICRWVEAILDGRELTSEGESDGTQDRRQGSAATAAGEEQAREAEPKQQALDL